MQCGSSRGLTLVRTSDVAPWQWTTRTVASYSGGIVPHLHPSPRGGTGVSTGKHVDARDEALASGFGTVDEKGRISLAKSVRNVLGIEPGSHVAYLLLDGAVLVIPQDEHLAVITQRAQEALSTAGLTAQDLLDEVPTARAAVVSEAYGTNFLQELERLYAERHAGTHSEITPGKVAQRATLPGVIARPSPESWFLPLPRPRLGGGQRPSRRGSIRNRDRAGAANTKDGRSRPGATPLARGTIGRALRRSESSDGSTPRPRSRRGRESPSGE
jgi:bifunctional DNA-binding transcriptional regulator/antitoxin component of YhaV-PrlF toxin-antitoxin module